jgi:hypothetical protein
MVMNNRQAIAAIVKANPKLETKYNMVHQYYLDKGMDLHRLHEVIDSVIYKTVY